MKPIVYFSMFCFALISCSNPATVKTNEEQSTDTLQSAATETLSIKDSSLYDPLFIEGLKGYNQPVKLMDNFIVAGKDTTYFPEHLPLNKKLMFKGSDKQRQFVLSVTRTNMTNLDYEFRLSDKHQKTIENKSGKAVLNSMFFLDPESDYDKETGSDYGSYEYRDKSANCEFSVRIGIGTDPKGKYRAKLTYHCEDKSKPAIALEECPTLRTE